MDQFKEILGVIKRQHFWIVAPILLLIGIWGWMKSTKQLSEEFAANSQSVQGYISTMQAVRNISPHPNPEYHEEMQKLIDERRQNVKAAWEKKWERQKQQLKWPSALSENFVAIVDKMRPIEQVDPKKVNLSSTMRRGYANFIKDELPELAERIGAVWAPASGSSASNFSRNDFSSPERGMRNDEEASAAIVDWSPVNQAQLQARFNWGADPPTTKQVLYAQEDLWVLSTLIDIIKATNGDVMIQSQAAIKQIDFIQLGASVVPPAKTGFQAIKPQPVSDSESEGEEEEEVAEEMNFGGDNVGGADGGELDFGMAQEQKEAILIKDRYYDENYEPIADKETLEASVTVAKRIPVRVRVTMDQRHIGRFLVECANAPLTFEVRQTRFNPGGNSGTSDGGRAGEIAAAEGFNINPSGQVRRLPDYQSFDRTVEVFGIVYIFNPVDDVVLGLEEGDASAAVEDEEEEDE